MNNPIPSIDERIIRCYRLQASKHPGWLSGTDIAGKAWKDALWGYLFGIPVPVTEISERQEQRHRLQQLSKMRCLTPKLCPTHHIGLLFGAVSLLEAISRNVAYKLRANNRSAMDDILIAGCSAMSAMSLGGWIYGLAGPGNIAVSALVGLVNAGIESSVLSIICER